MSTIALAALLVHHCTDEDGYVSIELHAPMIRAMAIAAKEEHDSLRAEIAGKNILIADREQLIGEKQAEIDSLRDEVTDLHMVAQSIKHYWQCDPAAGIPCVRCQRDAIQAERDRYLAAIVEYVGVEDAKEIEGAYAVLRRIAEEAR